MTKKEIAKMIDHTLLKPATTAQIVTLCAEAKVGDKCGGCREDLQMILNQVLAEQ